MRFYVFTLLIHRKRRDEINDILSQPQKGKSTREFYGTISGPRLCPHQQPHLCAASPRFPELESPETAAAAVSLWKHKRLFGARPSGRPTTRKVLLDRTGEYGVRSADSLAPRAKLTSSFLLLLPRKVGIKKALCKYTLTHSPAHGDGDRAATVCLPANRGGRRMNAALM